MNRKAVPSPASIAVTVVLLFALLAGKAHAAPGDSCKNQACRGHIKHAIHVKWRAEARPYQSWIASTTECESGSSGHYSLITTGNGFWFAGQFTPSTWRSVGGRMVGGVPHGVWSALPDRAEQDARMVRAFKSQGPGAWPICGH